jgi:hypothetical protein
MTLSPDQSCQDTLRLYIQESIERVGEWGKQLVRICGAFGLWQ